METHLPMQGDAFLSLLPRSCLAVRAGEAACSACAQACPARALVVDGDGPRLSADCLHCGRCAVACPSGALQADGFMDVMPAPGRGPIEVECAKASGSAAPNAMRVPCLGGISPTLLLRWWLAAGARPLMTINRNWCAGCAAGDGEHAAEASLRQVRRWLQECGVPSSSWPVVREAPSSPHGPPQDNPLPQKKAPALSRRGFFRRVTTDVSQPERQADVPRGPRAQLLRTPCALPARQQMLDTLGKLAERQGCAVPADALPSLVVSDRCSDHGLCARVCPTHALSRVESNEEVALHFDASRCVSCRLCEQGCPEQALRLGTDGLCASVVVRRRATASCIECGSTFVADQESSRCPRCAGRTQLAASMFGTRHAQDAVSTTRISTVPRSKQ